VVDADGASADVYDDGRLRVEHDNYYVAFAGRRAQLPRKELLLLSRLARSPGRVVASEELWNHALPAGAARTRLPRKKCGGLTTRGLY